ncbi:MAG: hypothetical protein ACOC1E_01235, partial [Marinilabiliaceae bacterium]
SKPPASGSLYDQPVVDEAVFVPPPQDAKTIKPNPRVKIKSLDFNLITYSCISCVNFVSITNHQTLKEEILFFSWLLQNK